MEIYFLISVLSGIVETLRKAHEIFLRKGRVIPSITLLFLLLNSIILSLNIFSTRSLLTDFFHNLTTLAVNHPNPHSPAFAKLDLSLKHDLRSYAEFEWLSIAASYLIASFFETAIILVASSDDDDDDHGSVLGFAYVVAKTWTRSFVSFLYKAVLDLGYTFFVLLFIFPPVLVVENKLAASVVMITLTIAGEILYLRLALVWTLSIVVSVLEEDKISGCEALGKASKLVKNSCLELKGFFLNMAFGTTHYVLWKLLITSTFSIRKSSASLNVVVLLIYLNVALIVKVFSSTAFTVFYYECKANNGEEVSDDRLMDNNIVTYTKLSSNNTDLP